MDCEGDYAAIKKGFQTFVKAWETGAIAQIDQCMIPDPVVDMSIFSIMYSREALKRALAYGKVPNSTIGFSIHNYVCRIDGSTAKQSAALFGTIMKRSEEGLRYYTFSGQFANQFVQCGNGWKISQVHFDLLDDNSMVTTLRKGFRPRRSMGPGDRSLTVGWNPICPNVDPDEARVIPRICGELHSPWSMITQRQDSRTDEIQVRELFYRWAFAVDCNTTALLVDILAENMVVNFCGVDYDREVVIRNLKSFQLWMGGRYHHVAQFAQLTVQGNTAQAIIFCRTPSMIMPPKIASEMLDQDLWCARCNLTAEKAQNSWRIAGLSYQFGSFVSERQNDKS